MDEHLEQSLNLAWVLLAAFLVMFMQAGFAMVETGFTRSRNAVQHDGDELHHLSDRGAGFLDRRVSASCGAA